MSLLSIKFRVAEYVKATGKTTIEAVRELWSDLTFTEEEDTHLRQKGLAAEVNPLTNSNQKMESVRRLITITNHETQPATKAPITMDVVIQKHEPKTWSLDVRILRGTMYDINGNEKKAMYDFRLSDCDYVIERGRAVIRGQERHLAVFEYTRKQLQMNGVSVVHELPDDEIHRLAHIVDQVKKGEEPFGDNPTQPLPVPPSFDPGGQGGPAELGAA